MKDTQIYEGRFGAAGAEKHYLNLTNGLNSIEKHYFSDINVIRIQSTKCEDPGQYEDIIMDLDYDFLLHIALGFKVIVHDYTHRGRNNKPRAIWQGLKWVEFVLNRIWFNKEMRCENGMNVFFQERYKKLSKKTRNKIKYFRKFLKTDHLTIEGRTDLTTHDGDYSYFSNLLDKWLKGEIIYR